ncbi:protein SPA1-RELATED 4-like [Cynara cardunculus var. scolymus]|uniref:protein SPA1-RELATED 4-like n=1 Tax=Cynara cardunculus var. scolymus TaxID=59895 RepID=UPI000D630710|nr:protein SPA1-RELATED 4-like [Cynara cardunculus var. scolymus]
MDNSSENGWQRPSNRNPRSIPATTTIFSGEFDRNHATKLEKDFDPLEVKDVSLRQWLDSENRTVDPLECLHIFMQIVKIVSLAHSEGIIVHTVRPSCFVMSSFNDVSFIESVSGSDSDSGSDCFVDVTSCSQKSNSKPENALETCNSQLENTWSGLDSDQVKETEEQKHRFPMKPILEMETKWYTSPEEAAGGPSSCASDVYRLGVLLFELYCPCSSSPEKNATMSNLRHRVFPPQLHLKWPKEAFFSMRLLHPDPASRPKIDEVLESELLKGPRQNLEEREAVIELEEKIVEQDMLLEFLLVLQKRRQEAADFLKRDVSFLTSDLKEVTKLQTSIRKNRLHATDLSQNNDSASSGSRKRIRTLAQVHNADESDDQENQENVPVSSRLMKNFKKLESAYFLTRHKTSKSIGKPLARNRAVNGDGKGSVSLETNSPSEGQIGWINPFLEGLSKYMSFSKLKVKADLKQGDLLNSSNLICSLGFDRDGEFFATAGVNKKIKVFEYDSILNENQDFHFPIVEIPTRSKLSSICWNGYIKSQIASSNFEGVVQVWDVTQNQVSAEMREHERRVWSVDFSADPTLLASGSDDGSVKLWNVNQGASIGTIRTKANVCCVQFPSDPGNFLAFGSADHRVYYYDLRNLSIPLCTLVGHNKTVSYIKFLDSTTLVSSSTDNTMKLWDLSDCTSRVLDCPIQTLTGHVNVKNFVGLSVSEGYIATGSETNEVVIYHKAFPMPALSYRFSTTDPISGNEVDDTEQFISSVCWRNQSNTLIAANSMGNIKILEMV